MVQVYTILNTRVDNDICLNLIRQIERSLHEPTDYHKIRLWDNQLWTVVNDALMTDPQFRTLSLGLRWTCHRYTGGGSLPPHQDGSKYGSMYSVLVYLNDDFSGGLTNFLSKPDEHAITQSVKPVRGTIMVLCQDKWHMSTAVCSGVKFIARADLCRHNTEVNQDAEVFEILV